MEVLSDSEWDDFDRFVETLGPLYVAEEEIVFRGEDIPIDLEYVRKPAHDALKAAELLENDPNLFSDAGLYTVLPIAKSVEMHLDSYTLETKDQHFRTNTSRHQPHKVNIRLVEIKPRGRTYSQRNEL